MGSDEELTLRHRLRQNKMTAPEAIESSGAVNLTMKDQAAHPNPVKGTTMEEEDHVIPSKLVAGLLGTEQVEWINCGLCVDERGSGSWVDGARRGAPADFLKWSQESTNTLVIGTK